MKKKMSFRHALSVHFRAAKALHGVSRRFFPAATLYTVVGAILPYVTVFFSAQILKELALLRRPDVLRNWVIAGVLCTGLCAVAKAVLFQRTETMLDDLYGRKETLFCRKFFSMDYADVDKQETRDLRAQIAQNENWSSFGLMQVPEIYERTLKSLIGILSGIALTVTLFTSPVPESAGKLTALNNPLFILILAGVMILISILAGRLEEKATSYWSCVAEEATLSNRVFSFFGFIGEHKGRGADIRMYNQQNLVTFYWNGDCDKFFDDWYCYAVPRQGGYVYSLFKLREQEFDAKNGLIADGDTPGVTVSFIAFDTEVLAQCLSEPTVANRKRLNQEINRVVAARGQRHDRTLKAYFLSPKAKGPYLIAELYVRHIASFAGDGCIDVPEHYAEIYRKSAAAGFHGWAGRIPRFLEENNKAAGHTVCDHEKIYIQNPDSLSVYEKRAILATHAANVSVHSFAAEVRFHARFLTWYARLPMRPKPFCSVIFNESDLMDKFDIHVIPVNLAVIQDKYNRILETRKDELAEGVAKLRQMYEIDDLSEPVLDKVYAFVLLYEEIFEEYNVAAVSAECWTAMQLMVGVMPCAAYPLLADMGYIIGCESDMHATLTQVVLKSLTLGQKKPFLGEFTTRHPSDRNVELLWHCGPFAYSLKKHGTGAKMVNMRQWMQVEDGHFTVARIDQDHGNYSIAVCECDSAEGPYTFGSYMWGKFKDLPAVERKLIEGPYIHHMSEIEGSLTDSIREFCKYVPGLTFDGLD